MTTREERMRFVARLQRRVAMEEPLTTPEQRKRVVEVLHLEAGMPPPPWVARTAKPKARGEPIDVAPIKAAWDQIQRDRAARYETQGILLENHGSRARCRRCGDVLMDVPYGLVGVTPSALYVMHVQQTGCR